tara:strand:+ start:71 stop:592 length:522 start_codon:yes stop_codon:yes gene_type:complete
MDNEDSYNIYSNPLFDNYKLFDKNIIKNLESIDYNIVGKLNKLEINGYNVDLIELDKLLKNLQNIIKYYNILTIKQEKQIRKYINNSPKLLKTMRQQYFKNLIIFKNLIKKKKEIIPENSLLCDICLSEKKTIVFIPCGHLICKSCKNTNKNYNYNKCYFCRNIIEDYQEIYL